MSKPISVIIHTLNEEQNIRNCLESVKWADEIIVVDMYSEDKTVETAHKYTDKILMHDRCRYVEPARQWAIEQAAHEWVLVIDADELVPIKTRNLLRDIADKDMYDVVLIPRVNYLFGHRMEGSRRGADEDRQCRFFKKSLIRYTPKIHSFPQICQDAQVGWLSGQDQALIHFNYIDIEHFIQRLNCYTTIEAETAHSAGRSFHLEKDFSHSMKQIQDIAISEEGLKKDGIYGLGVAVLMAMYHFSTALKLKLIEDYNSTNPGTAIRQRYQDIANEIIKQYSEK